jgi:hypothetical protein
MAARISVVKYSAYGEEMVRYPAMVLERLNDERIVVEAHFSLQAHQVGAMLLNLGDRFVERYTRDEWFNILEVHDQATDALKGWYCNVSYPAEIGRDQVSYRDLALDLVVLPDGRQEVLDEDEFAALELPEADMARARAGLQELQRRFGEQFAAVKK